MTSANKWIILFLSLILLISFIALGSFYDFMRSGPLPEDRITLIEKGESIHEMADQLESAGVIRDAFLFKAYVALSQKHKSLRAGEYLFPLKASYQEVVDILVKGESIVHQLTIPEGLTMREIFNLVEAAERLSGVLPTPLPDEGELMPETYNYTYGDTRSDMVLRMKKEMVTFFDKAWAMRDQSMMLTTKEEVLTLASIVEKETALPIERPLVAGLYLNRLAIKMPLQADPTVVYGLTEGKFDLGRDLTLIDLKDLSPYNTYVHAGLPPKPICSPGKKSIEAVLNPEKSAYLYFVANGEGGHVFAVTYDEHLKNVAKWRVIKKTQILSAIFK
jgi:UPF0755 protein